MILCKYQQISLPLTVPTLARLLKQMISPLSTDECWYRRKIGFLALVSTPDIGYWRLRKIYELQTIDFALLGSVNYQAELAKLLQHSEMGEIVKKSIPIFDRLIRFAAHQLEYLAEHNIRLLLIGEPGFPEALLQIPDPPYWLFVQGDLQLLSEPSIAVIGTRKPTADGIFLAEFIGRTFPLLKAPVISGLAVGVDQIAHNLCVRFKIPAIAVLGHGLFVSSSKASQALMDAIITQGGTVVSEYLPKQSYSAENFVRRNRIQAALSRILLPVEWKLKSGSAHTVRYAEKYRRQIIGLHCPGQWNETNSYLANLGYKNFQVPGDEGQLIDYVEHALSLPYESTAKQPDFFLGDA